MVRLILTLAPDIFAALAKSAKRKGITIQAEIRNACADYLARFSEGVKP